MVPEVYEPNRAIRDAGDARHQIAASSVDARRRYVELLFQPTHKGRKSS
jgi:hypothetical protein